MILLSPQGCYFSSVEDLNNKKAAIIPTKTAIGDGNA
jgi:hypothetical protein